MKVFRFQVVHTPYMEGSTVLDEGFYLDEKRRDIEAADSVKQMREEGYLPVVDSELVLDTVEVVE